MLEQIKDQEMTLFKKYIDDGNHKAALNYLDELKLSEEMELYYKSFILYKDGNLVKARQVLEMSMSKGFYNPESIKALKTLKQELNIESIESENSSLDNIFLSLKTYPADLMLAATLVIGLFFTVSLGRKMLVSSLVLFTLFCGAGYLTYAINEKDLFIANEDITVRSGPSRIFEESQVIYPGMKFMVDKEFEDWKHIEYPKSHQGWVYKPKVLTL